MKALDEIQKKFLRGLAHPKEPVARAGQAGLTDNLLKEIAVQLLAHELIKVKVAAADRETRDRQIAEICKTTGAVLVQRIGHVAVLYLRHAKKPKIILPGEQLRTKDRPGGRSLPGNTRKKKKRYS